MNIYAVFNFVGIISILFLGNFVYSKAPTNKLNRIFLVYSLAIAYTGIIEFLRATAATAETAYMWNKYSFVWPFIPVIFLKFVLVLSDHKFNSIKNINIYLAIPAAIISVFHFFTDRLYSGMEKRWFGWEVIKADNIYEIIITAYFLLTTVLSIYIIILFYLQQKSEKKKKQALYAIIGLSILLLASYLSEGFLPMVGIDAPPFETASNILAAVFLAISIIKFNFFIPDPSDTILKLFSAVSDFLLIFNKQGEVIIANKSFLNSSQFSTDDITGRKISTLFKNNNNIDFNNLDYIIGKDVELEMIGKNEKQITLSAVFSYIHGIKKENLYLLLGRDLSERKNFEKKLLLLKSELEEKVEIRTEELAHANEELRLEIDERNKIAEALSESEARYRNLFENSPIGIYRTTPGGKILMANPAIIKMLGFNSFEDLIAKNLEEENIKQHDYKRENFKEKIEKEGEIIGFESKWYKVDGTEITIRENAKCIYDETGNIVCYDGTVEDISDKIKIEEALKKSEERYRNLIENINELYYVADANGIITYVSPNIQNFTGYKIDTWLNKKALHFVHKEDRKQIIRFYMENRDAGALDGRIEFRTIKNDGTMLWVEQLTRFVRDDKNNLVEYHNVVRDITERKLAEDKLNLLAQAIKHTGDGISITDLNNNLLFVNEAFQKIYGYHESEIIGENISSIHSSCNDIELIEEIREQTVLNGWSGELINTKKDGTLFPISLTTSNVLNDKGEVYALVGVMRDITERKKVEKQLEEYKNHLEILVEERTQKLDKVNKLLKNEIEKLKIAEENIQNQLVFLQTLIDTIPNPIFMRDVNKIYTGCNTAFEKFHGIKKEDIIGKNIFESNINPNYDIINQKDDEILANPGQQSYELKAIDGEGKVHETIIYKASFYKSDGNIGGIVGVMLDITELKKMEKETLKALEREKELNQLKSRFISVASHEFRTPLTMILSAADLLEMFGKKWPENKYYQYIHNIQNAVDYLTELITDVLTVNRAEAGKLVYNPAVTDLFDLVNKILEEAKLSAPKNIAFSYNYKLKDRLFKIDGKLLKHIISNLISNSVKYSIKGGEVIITVKRDKNNMLIMVSDEGIGIPEEDQPKLFEAFHRGNNVGTIPGTGLGLSIVLKSVEAHHGSLKIKSKLDEGTLITVIFNYNSLAVSE